MLLIGKKNKDHNNILQRKYKKWVQGKIDGSILLKKNYI
jgi:hypothetical protein